MVGLTLNRKVALVTNCIWCALSGKQGSAHAEVEWHLTLQ